MNHSPPRRVSTPPVFIATSNRTEDKSGANRVLPMASRTRRFDFTENTGEKPPLAVNPPRRVSTPPVFVAMKTTKSGAPRYHGPFPTSDAANDWLLENLGPTDAGASYKLHSTGKKPPLTAEAWMLVRLIRALLRSPSHSASASLEVSRTVAYMLAQYGHPQVTQAVDAINEEYK